MIPDEKLLWEAYNREPSVENRNNLVMHYESFVKIVVNRLVSCYNAYIDREDLLAYGMIGLIYAIEKYDPGRGIKFETYASIRIRGYIIDEIRRQDILPTSVRRKIKYIESVYAELENELDRSPEDSEVAERLGITVSKLRKLFGQSHLSNIVSFDAVIADNMEIGPEMSERYNPEQAAENHFLQQWLAEEIENLPEKEKLVVNLYYNDGLTLKEIGLVIGVSESRVSQIHSKILMKLRSKLNKLA
ncbi:MAG: FliA/WhiG family RNA polymerase sigma factor [Oscillospiraceae bacterium]|nr:FliA/WhiG family RNA polymerase sigma factor [Oscillospiraceae bacterium]